MGAAAAGDVVTSKNESETISALILMTLIIQCEHENDGN